jgi:G3E family GTPase
VQPLKDLCGEQFSVAPYGVLFKPSHGLRILRNEAGAGFSPKAAYIFRKQLEEADVILMNRIDELSGENVEELCGLVGAQYPNTPVLRISAKNGQGFDGLTEFLNQEGRFGTKLLDIDYDVYAEGEAELGWLNSSVSIRAAQPFPLDDLLLEILGHLQKSLLKAKAEVAHLKTIGLWEGFFGVANLIASRATPELSLPSHAQVQDVEVIVNARVAIEPEVLEAEARSAVEHACRMRGAVPTFRATQSFRPGRPQPTHRYLQAK